MNRPTDHPAHPHDHGVPGSVQPARGALSLDRARRVVLDALAAVAPDIDPAVVGPDTELGRGLDLDSMDFLNVVEHVSAALGRDIPERDFPQLATLATFTRYLNGGDVPG